MAKNIGGVICSAVILIIMSIAFGNPGGIAGAVIFSVCYIGCMMMKGDSSDNSSAEFVDINRKDAVLIICPYCNKKSIYKIEELKKCRKCGRNLE